MSAGVKVVEGWEDHPASLGMTVTMVGVDWECSKVRK